ncbi:uncharacterized protein LOC131645775 [Vicia villosa]|uniref:uncharacterized protein LOC131645775 n=1 Tax=Vicia villosa TaxID=3911 RepID=UPI00273B75A7|nr:uncharacterized protein LOC131645775 [Vicia villosa]
MITDSTHGDTLVFYFCGHGGRTPATDYNNNSGFVEYMCCSDGSIITDSNLRHLTECVPAGCSFTVVADCTASGGLIEGAKEILGHSTETPVTNKIPLTSNIWEPTLGTARRPLGILLSACQTDEEARAAINFNRLESACFYTDALILVIQETKGNVTNWNLVKTIRHMFRSMQWKQVPGLYCDESQVNLNFLGLNGSEIAEKGHSGRKLNVAKMSKRERILGNPYVYVGEISKMLSILGQPFVFSHTENIGDLLLPRKRTSFEVFRAMSMAYHNAFNARFEVLASVKIEELESMERTRGKMKDVLKWIAATYLGQKDGERRGNKDESYKKKKKKNESLKRKRKRKSHDRGEKKEESSKKKRKNSHDRGEKKESLKKKRKKN